MHNSRGLFNPLYIRLNQLCIQHGLHGKWQKLNVEFRTVPLVTHVQRALLKKLCLAALAIIQLLAP
jgi:hypothetical protein